MYKIKVNIINYLNLHRASNTFHEIGYRKLPQWLLSIENESFQQFKIPKNCAIDLIFKTNIQDSFSMKLWHFSWADFMEKVWITSYDNTQLGVKPPKRITEHLQ